MQPPSAAALYMLGQVVVPFAQASVLLTLLQVASAVLTHWEGRCERTGGLSHTPLVVRAVPSRLTPPFGQLA